MKSWSSGSLTRNFSAHYLGALSVEPSGNFVDVLHRDVISAMNSEHGVLLQRLNLGAITAQTMSEYDAEVTQAIARSAYASGYDGITSLSKFGRPYTNWTIFETGRETQGFRVAVELSEVPEKLSVQHAIVSEALETFGLRIDATGSIHPGEAAGLPHQGKISSRR